MPTNSEATIPKFLYRYRAFQDNYDSLRKILQENLWYFGSRVNFDDQEDCIVSGIELDRGYLENLLRARKGLLSAEQLNRIEQFLSDPDAGNESLPKRKGMLITSEYSA